MRVIKAFGAAIVLAVLIAGPPWLLVTYIGNPWPAEGISLMAPLTDNAIIGVLAAVVWVLWAQLMACIVAEAIAVFSNDRIQIRVPITFGAQQQLARRLVTAIVIATVATPLAAGSAIAASGHSPTTPDHGPGTGTTTSQTLRTWSQNTTGSHDQPGSPTSTQQQSAEQTSTPGGATAGDRRAVGSASTTSTVTVMRLDSLWSIAERVLGDGDRWNDIAALNDGRTMNDGATFLSADHIKPGWELLVPGNVGDQAKPSTPAAPTETEVVVQAGDTLSEIAQRELGDADAYPQIVSASTDITQFGGRHLSDPDVIDVGWTLRVVDDTDNADDVAPQRPTQVEQPTPLEQQPTPVEQPPVAQPPVEQPPVEQPTPAQEADQEADQADHIGEDEGWPVRTMGGVGALLAGALLGLISRRRGRQRRLRRPGVAMPLPSPAAGAVEQEIRAVADVSGTDQIDLALRALAAGVARTGAKLPELRVARLTGEQLDLYLTSPAELPEPWQPTSDPAVWVLATELVSDLADELERADSEVRAPYPALVTVGHDVEDGMILLNLSHVGSLGVVGQDPWVSDALTGIALELGTAPWAADQLTITSIGSLAELGRLLEPGRLRYVPAPEDTAGAGGELVDQVTGSATSGHVHLVLDTSATLARSQHDELRAQGALVITRGWFAEGWALDVQTPDAARMLPLGLEIAPQLVDQRTYNGLIEILQTAQVDPNAAPGAGHHNDNPTEPHLLPFDTDPPEAESPPAPVEVSPRADVTVQAVPATQSSWMVDGVSATTSAPAGAFRALEQELEEALGDRSTAGDVPPAGAEESNVDDLQSLRPGAVPTVGAPVSEAPEAAAEVVLVGQADAQFADVVRPTLVPGDPEAATEDLGDVDEVCDRSCVDALGVGDVVEPAAPAGLVDVALIDQVDVVHPLLQTGHPVIRLLGPVVDIIGATAVSPTSETHRKVCTRVAVYLALNPTTSRPSLTQGVWGGQRISAGTVDSRVSNLRAWLGAEPETGEKYLPARSLRFLDQVTTDWRVFTELVGSNPAGTSTAALEQALSLVRGRPLEGEESKHYGFAEYFLSDVVDVVVDTAYELARRRYMDSSWRKAGQAAALGVLLDPGNERLWRIRIHAAHSSGNATEVAEAIARMHARISELGFDLEDETVELLRALEQQDTVTIEQSREAL